MSSSTQPPRIPYNAPDRSVQRDPVSDPEPPVPSLPEPDPGVFHHDPAPDPTKTPKDCT
ncbi:MAG TPA: hypothetical protein VN734_05345 [Acidobacteriaceae bacterium]|nr:hypothetical protein [Acidobacteriaceae bacterium]